MNKGFPSEQKIGAQKYATLQPVGAGRYGSDVLPKALYPLQALDFVPVGGTNRSIEIVGTGAIKGDVVRFTAGAEDGVEVTVLKVTGDVLEFGHKFDTVFSAVDTCQILRPITLTITKEGELSTSSGPVRFIKDAIEQLVIKDTVTSSNTVGMPVEIVGTNGAEINITAGDIGVQLSHAGATPDSTRIGDGVTELGIIPITKEAKVSDAEALLKLED